MYDLFIVGGGINGTGIACDVAARHLQVGLCEQNDLASGTSFASSKLIHGGLRYLEQLHFNLVRKALREREILLYKAPHLVKPVPFIIPHQSGSRPAWFIRLGLFLYDHLYLRQKLLPSRQIHFTSEQVLLPHYRKGFSYMDCLTDDARFTVTNALAAKENGATIMTRMRLSRAQRFPTHWEATLEDMETGKMQTISTKVLVNVSGAWVDVVNNIIDPQHQNPLIRKVKGSHIVVPRLYEGDNAYLLQNPDGRVIFVMPFQHNFHLIGTTEIEIKDMSEATKVTPAERGYLCDSVNRYFVKHISPADIVWEYAGVRVLQLKESESANQNTRDYAFAVDDAAAPLLTVVGGKLTTHRILAQEAVDLLKPYLPKMAAGSTENTLLPGGDIGANGIDQFCYTTQKQFSWLPPEIIHRYAHAYGSRLFMILKDKHNLADMGHHFGHGLFAAEVNYLCQHEWAKTCDDILWRRTKLGLVFNADEKQSLDGYLKNFLLEFQ